MSAAAKAHSKRRPLTVAEKISKHQRTLERAKQLYDRADMLLLEILKPYLETCKQCGGKSLKPGPLVKGAHVELTADGKAAILLDNFQNQEIVWGHGGVRHYGIKIVKV